MLLPLYSPFLFSSLCPNLQGQGQRGEGTGGALPWTQRHRESQNGIWVEGQREKEEDSAMKGQKGGIQFLCDLVEGR